MTTLLKSLTNRVANELSYSSFMLAQLGNSLITLNPDQAQASS